MKPDRLKHHRHSIRLKGFDYSQAASYFVTLVSHQRAALFGEIVRNETQLNKTGKIIEAAWLALEARFPTIALDEFVIMPNHLHAILTIIPDPPIDLPIQTYPDQVGATLVVAPVPPANPSLATNPIPGSTQVGTSPAPTNTAPTLGDVIGAFKSITTHEIILAVRRGDLPPFAGKIWQRNYYEHIIRNEGEWARISQYICENPVRWAEDAENPIASGGDAAKELMGVLNNRNDKSNGLEQ